MVLWIGVDLAILIFTLKGWKKTALIYLLGTFAHNLVYQFYPESVYRAILIGVMLSGTIFAFSHLFYADMPTKKHSTLSSINQLKQNGIAYDIKPYKCPECSKSFATYKQLNGHISSHKQTGNWHEEKYGDWEKENESRGIFLESISHIEKGDFNKSFIRRSEN